MFQSIFQGRTELYFPVSNDFAGIRFTSSLYPSSQPFSAALLVSSCSNLSLSACTRNCGEQLQQQPEPLQLLSVDELSPGLQPLLLWMANSIELLHFVQHDVPQLLPWRREREHAGGPADRARSVLSRFIVNSFWVFFPGLPDAEVSSTRAACEEAMTVLEEVIMFTFQQSVYYLTKVRVACRKREAGLCKQPPCSVFQTEKHDGGMEKSDSCSGKGPDSHMTRQPT